MFSKDLLDAMNEQMKNEFFSGYLYQAMAGYFEAEDLPGIASWMRVQALEELTHGEKFFYFMCARKLCDRQHQQADGSCPRRQQSRGPDLFAVVCHRTSRRRGQLRFDFEKIAAHRRRRQRPAPP